MLHGYLASAVLDLTPQADNLAVAAIQLNVKYVAFCNTPAHVEMLQKRLQDRIFELQPARACAMQWLSRSSISCRGEMRRTQTAW